MAEGIAVSVITEILNKLGASAAHETGLMLGVTGELKKLRNKVEMIQKVLEDAEKRQVNDEAIRLWLQRLKQVAYDAEDMLDEVAYETLRRKMEIQNHFKNKVRNFFSLSNPLAFRLKMAHRVQGVNRMLDDITKEKDDFNLKEEQAASANKTSLDRDTSPFIDDTDVFGRENEKSIVMKLLLDDSSANIEDNVSVISIVGFGGLGKTTLAQLVYKDEEVSKCFSLKGWICVANDDSSDKTLLGEVFRGICENHSESPNKGQMQESLKEKLQEKKFLLVLDDVWNSNQWEDVRIILKRGAPGSKVIVTTRREEVANDMGTVRSLHLGRLSEVHCQAVFEKRAFRMGGPGKTRNLEEIGWKIVEKCGGVPLAVKALGSLMHSKKTLSEWKVIQNSENLNIVGDNVMKVLRLSYNHLPSPLKQCFQYCAIFPKDTKLLKNDLIQQWMAQGFIPSSNDLEMEDIGNDYFQTLCWNSFFQDMEVDKNHDIISCKMHDLVRDLAQSIVGKELFVFSHKTVTENINIEETRHLTMSFDNMEMNLAIPKNLYQAKKLHTFFSNGNEANDAWSKFKFIRVLHLERITELSSSICKLKLLRYLCIKSWSLKALPRSICRLYFLETLNVEYCYDLKRLPKDIWKLTNLRHLYIRKSTKIPKKFGRLCGLRSISPVLYLGKEEDGCRIGELEHLNNLGGNLRIYNMEDVRNTMDARKAKLREKGKIYRLEMHWDDERESGGDGTGTNYEEVAEALEAPPNLKELILIGFPGVKLPLTTWLANDSLPYLVEIKLANCRNLQEIPPIWHIQSSLEILEIEHMDKVKLLGGKCTSTRAPAASRLRRLSLWKMAELEEWVENATITHNSFPYLEELIVKNCEKLRTAPSHFPALKEIRLVCVGEEGVSLMLSKPLSPTSLKKMEISNCRCLTSAGNVARLPHLEKLHVEDCPELSLTLASFPSLKEIYLSKIYGLDMMKCSSATNDCHHHLTSLTSLCVEDVPEFTGVPKGFLQSSSSEHLQSVLVKSCGRFQGFVPAGTDGVGEDQELPLFSSNLKRIEIISCPDMETMDVRGLTSLEFLEITDCKRLQCSPLGLQSLRALKKLSLEYSPNVILTGYDAVSGACCWPHLERLEISFCDNVAVNTSQFPSLTMLQFSSIDCIVMEPVANNRLTSLTHLGIVGVKEFTSLPQGLLQNCANHLQELQIKDCSTFQGFVQDELQGPVSLKKLHVEGCAGLTSLNVSGLVSLTELTIMNCRGFESSPKGLHSLSHLCTLRIGGFSEELDHLPFSVIEQDTNDSPLCSSLKHLTIWGCSRIKSLPHQLQHLTALSTLEIRCFDALTALPDWLGSLSSLNQLEIIDCQRLMHLPSKPQMRRLTSLFLVNIKGCPLVSKRVRSDDLEHLKILGFEISYDGSNVTAIHSLRERIHIAVLVNRAALQFIHQHKL